jgi:hypothetical protein
MSLGKWDIFQLEALQSTVFTDEWSGYSVAATDGTKTAYS